MANPTVRDVHVDAVLTNISIAYKNPNYLADQIFPVVPVQKKSDFYYVFDKSSWFRNEVAPRAPGTQAQEGDYGITTASYNCITRAIAKVVPDEVRKNADNPLAPELEASEWVTDVLLRGMEKRVADKTTGGSGLWTYSTTPSVQWSNDSSTPWTDIDGCVNGIISVTGQRPNVAVMSWDVWRYLRNHPDFLERIKFTRPGSQVLPTDLNAWFGFDKVLIGTQLIDSAQEGATASFSYIWGDGFWCGYVPGSPSLRTPAAGMVFEWEGRQVQRFRMDLRHSDFFEASHSTAEMISASDAGAILYNVI